jgi:hypothetical protein
MAWIGFDIICCAPAAATFAGVQENEQPPEKNARVAQGKATKKIDLCVFIPGSRIRTSFAWPKKCD